jgi:hypothetical protein
LIIDLQFSKEAFNMIIHMLQSLLSLVFFITPYQIIHAEEVETERTNPAGNYVSKRHATKFVTCDLLNIINTRRHWKVMWLLRGFASL